MQTKEALIKILSDGGFYSGQRLGQMLGVSRSAVWKQIQALSGYGLDVYAVTGKGYRLESPIELLDVEAISAALDPQYKQLSMDVLFEIDSTNRYLFDIAQRRERTPSVCLAEFQSHGRGRRGRQWVSPLGANLYCSILWRSELPLHALSCSGLIVSMAIVDVLRDIGVDDVMIKWPNDIYWNDKKMAGVLIESVGEVNAPSQLVIGFGVNVAMPISASSSIDQSWVDVTTALGRCFSRNVLTGKILNSVFSKLAQYEKHGFEYFMNAWHKLDLLYAKPIVLMQSDRIVRGIADGIDVNGALLVKSADGIGRKRYYSGEVSVRYEV